MSVSVLRRSWVSHLLHVQNSADRSRYTQGLVFLFLLLFLISLNTFIDPWTSVSHRINGYAKISENIVDQNNWGEPMNEAVLSPSEIETMSSGGVPLIVAWTSIYGASMVNELSGSLKNCPYKCGWVDRKFWLKKLSHIVPSGYVVHIRNLNPNDLPKREPHQIIVYMLQESPPHTHGEMYKVPKDYWNATMTYRLDSDYFLPYGEFVKLNGSETDDEKWSPGEIDGIVKNKTKGGLAFISNCITHSKREDYLRELKLYTNLTIYGCGNLKTIRGFCKYLSKCEMDNIASHRFYMSFENSVCLDYMSEKFTKRLSQLLVPVILRRKIAEVESIPKNSFIAADDFESPKHLGEHMNMLMNNDEEYKKLLEWTKNYRKGLSPGNALCKMCQDIHKKTVRIIPDIVETYVKSGNCDVSGSYNKNASKTIKY